MEEKQRFSFMDRHGIILFDGVCNLCNGAVTFIIDRDPADYFRFAPLQSEVARRLLHNVKADSSLSSLVLLEGGQCYTCSTAVVRIARRLRGGWPLLFGLIILPRPARDFVYSWIAANRYRWFGKRETCRVPTPELVSRFL
jgi:predicted DCC family thiol-disulfide oxidoreductase YuxK